MAKLKSGLETLQLSNVRTYIQSGNVAFESTSKSAAALGKKISLLVEAQHGFRPQILLLTRADLLAAVDSNPFPQATSDPKTLHLFFLAERALTPDFRALDAKKSPTESHHLTDRVFYLHAPDGVGRSKLASTAERHLGVITTARNYRTVERILGMVASS